MYENAYPNLVQNFNVVEIDVFLSMKARIVIKSMVMNIVFDRMVLKNFQR